VRAVSIIIWDVGIACKVRIDDGIRFDTLKAVLNVVLFLGRTCSSGSTRGRVKLALVVCRGFRGVCGECGRGITNGALALCFTGFHLDGAI